MSTEIDATHDAAARSWIENANHPSTDFPLQNLPLGVFSRSGDARHRIGVAIGDAVLDVSACAELKLLDDLGPNVRSACVADTLNALFAIGRPAARAVRASAFALLRDAGAQSLAGDLRDRVVVPRDRCTLHVPSAIGDYSDFYASLHHATNVGAMFRPENPLLPNYKWIPIGYHGRASSIVASGADIRRPTGQARPDANAPPVFGPSRSLDYELEVGAFVARGNAHGDVIPLARTDEHVFGLCLVNDWSARDIQAWEYQPLGPFLAKSFATTVSPWVVTLEALAPFRVAALVREDGDPAPLPYLSDRDDREHGGFDIALEVWLRSAGMRERGEPAVRLTRGSFRDMYWTLGQMLAHHASNGCNMRPGDLIASGTVSGAGADSRGCLLELTSRGKNPVQLPSGETRAFLQDGDEVILRGECSRDGYRRIGFGECRGIVRAAG